MGQKWDKKAAYEEFFSSQDRCFNSLCTKICQLTILQRYAAIMLYKNELSRQSSSSIWHTSPLSMIILEGTKTWLLSSSIWIRFHSVPFLFLLLLLLLTHFPIFSPQLGMPIETEVMEGFWHSRCLNDRIEVPDMMRLFAGGATTPLVVKIWTKQP